MVDPQVLLPLGRGPLLEPQAFVLRVLVGITDVFAVAVHRVGVYVDRRLSLLLRDDPQTWSCVELGDALAVLLARQKVAELRTGGLRTGGSLEYFSSMKVKTSITLAPSTLRAIDQIAGKEKNRSRVIERAVLDFVERHRRRVREARDLEILNRSAEDLNREIEDVLAFQVEP